MKRGFTLIELLTVIAIIGILTSVVVVSTSKARSQARDAKRKSEINTVSGALEMYYANQRKYPIQTSWGWSSYLGDNTALKNFISVWPVDPLLPANPSAADIGFGKSYVYCSDANGTKYAIDATLEGSDSVTVNPAPGDPIQCSADSFFTGVYKVGEIYHTRVTNK